MLRVLLATMTWYQPNVTGTLPPARAYHTTNLIGRKLFVFGGRAGNKYYNDLHILNLGMATLDQAYLWLISCLQMV